MLTELRDAIGWSVGHGGDDGVVAQEPHLDALRHLDRPAHESGVDGAGRDTDEAVVEPELPERHAHARVQRAERAQDLGCQVRCPVCHEADVEVLGGTVAQFLCAALDGIDVAHRAPRRLERLSALGRQLDAPGHALEQDDAELGLQPPDREAERGLRDVQRLCRARDAACLRDGHELPELLDAEAHPVRRNHNASDMGPRAIGIGRAAISYLPSRPMSDTATKDATALPVPEPGLTPAEVIRRAEALRPRLLEEQAATEERTFYSEEMHRAFADAGFYRILQPRMFGGHEFDVPDFYRVIIEVSRGCPSSGWCLSLNAAHALQAGAFFSERAQREMFGPGGDFRCAARDTPRGHRPTGRWRLPRRRHVGLLLGQPVVDASDGRGDARGRSGRSSTTSSPAGSCS